MLPLFAPRRAVALDGESLPTNTRVPTVVGAGAGAYGRGREVAALVLWTCALFLLLGLASYAGDPHAAPGDEARSPVVGANWVGPVGEACAGAVVALVGVVAWALPFELALLGIPFVRGRKSNITAPRIAGDLLIAVLAAALMQVGWPGRLAFGRHVVGGAVGELFGELARSLFSTAGSFLVGFACLGLVLIARASFSFIAFVRLVSALSVGAWEKLRGAFAAIAEAWRKAREIEEDRHERERIAALPRIELAKDDVTLFVAEEAGDEFPMPASDGAIDVAAPAETDAPSTVAAEIVENESGPPPLDGDEPTKPKKGRRKAKDAGPTIVDTSGALAKEEPTKAPPPFHAGQGARRFELPSIEYLELAEVDARAVVDPEVATKNAEHLTKTLADYAVQGEVKDVFPGPTVTTYEFVPVAGTKVAKVASLSDDLALAFASKVRIVAPIPGKNRIGFELANEHRLPVTLRDLIDDRRFQSLACPLPVVLGRDIVGNPVYADLASMPHVIVAGATGAGKSVGLNVMLTSLLYRRTPDDLRLLMVDPKVVELAPFDRIPHMLLPVVTDMKQAATALKWAVDEMERRYQLFADAGTKNIGTYNGWVARVRRGDAKNPLPRTVIAKDSSGFTEEIVTTNGDEGEQKFPECLPFIVIVVDEFADLMMQQGKEVEVAIARLAQKARAAGMHVILATQRPSVDVITGMIKANFPTRIAFKVSQKVDSRTILDEQGAEHLLGRGDMLIKLNGTNDTKRVQGPWVSEEEVQRVTDFLRTQGEPVYDESILRPRDDDAEAAADDDGEQDPMYDAAVRLVSETRRCSTSWIQRKLSLGYNRAARLVETMERRGLVGPGQGAKDREVLIDAI